LLNRFQDPARSVMYCRLKRDTANPGLLQSGHDLRPDKELVKDPVQLQKLAVPSLWFRSKTKWNSLKTTDANRSQYEESYVANA
jgi:hypothetical protein